MQAQRKPWVIAIALAVLLMAVAAVLKGLPSSHAGFDHAQWSRSREYRRTVLSMVRGEVIVGGMGREEVISALGEPEEQASAGETYKPPVDASAFMYYRLPPKEHQYRADLIVVLGRDGRVVRTFVYED